MIPRGEEQSRNKCNVLVAVQNGIIFVAERENTRLFDYRRGCRLYRRALSFVGAFVNLPTACSRRRRRRRVLASTSSRIIAA